MRSRDSLPNFLKRAIEEAVQQDRKTRKVDVQESRKNAARVIHDIMARAHARVTRGADDGVELQEFKRRLGDLGVDWMTAAKFGALFFEKLRKPKGVLGYFLDVFRNTGD